MQVRSKRVTSLMRYFLLVDGFKITFRFHFDDNYFIFTKISRCFGRSLRSMSYLGLVQAYLLHRDFLAPLIRAVLMRMSVDYWIWMTTAFDMFSIKSPKLFLKYYESSARRHVLWSVRNWKMFLLENGTNFMNQFESFKLYQFIVDDARTFNRTDWIGSRSSSPYIKEHRSTLIKGDWLFDEETSAVLGIVVGCALGKISRSASRMSKSRLILHGGIALDREGFP